MDTILSKSSGETLSEHTISCLKAAHGLIASLPLSEDNKEVLNKDVLWAVAMHDVGKAAKGFQKVLRGEQRNWQKKRHEIISASFASSLKDIPSSVIFAIMTHHKSIPPDGISANFGCLPWEQIPIQNEETNVWNEMADEWNENAALFLHEWKKICQYLEGYVDTLGTIYTLKPLSLEPAWLERTTGKKGQIKTISFQDRFHASIVRGLTITSDHLGSAHKTPLSIPDINKYCILKKNPRPFQEIIGKTDGSAILRAPTGSGKTEGALLWAQKNQRTNGRLFYILPYTASINAMHHRLTKIFGDIYVGLLHHRATASLYGILEADEDISIRMEKQQIAKTLADLSREIWFPIRVCTPHQIIRYTLRGKGWETMLAEIPNACFIFDEIHAYDPRIVGLILSSARLLSSWGVRCLFLSATFPAFLRKLIYESMGNLPFIEPDPTKEEDRAVLDKKRHIVELKEGTVKDHIDTIVQAIHNSPSTLIVCNHVRTSQEIYSLLKKTLKEDIPLEKIKLIHSRFNSEDRNRVEDNLNKNYLPKVLVATQVVEVSLDVDFEQAFFEPAPIDALIQRMGRVNRYGNRPPAKVMIFTEQVNPYYLYCDCNGKSHDPNCRVRRTIDEIEKVMNPISEKDLIEAADNVYGDGYQGEDKKKFEEGLNHPDIKEFQKHLLAGSHQDWVDSIIEKTDGISEVLPISLHEKYMNKRNEGLWIEANSLLVPVRFRTIMGSIDKIDKSSDPWIIDCLYSPEEGLKIEKQLDRII